MRRQVVKQPARKQRTLARSDCETAAGARELAGDAQDDVHGHARFRRDALEGVVPREQRPQPFAPGRAGARRVLEPVGSLEHEIPVVKAFRDEHSGNAQGEDPFRPRPHGDPLVRRGGGDGEPGLDLDQLASPSRAALAELPVGPRHVDGGARGLEHRASQGEDVVG